MVLFLKLRVLNKDLRPVNQSSLSLDIVVNHHLNRWSASETDSFCVASGLITSVSHAVPIPIYSKITLLIEYRERSYQSIARWRSYVNIRYSQLKCVSATIIIILLTVTMTNCRKTIAIIIILTVGTRCLFWILTRMLTSMWELIGFWLYKYTSVERTAEKCIVSAEIAL